MGHWKVNTLVSDHFTTLSAACLAAISGLLAYLKSRQTAGRAEEVMRQIVEVKVSMDGRMDELLHLNRLQAHAVGLEEGTAIGNAAGEEKIQALLQAVIPGPIATPILVTIQPAVLATSPINSVGDA